MIVAEMWQTSILIILSIVKVSVFLHVYMQKQATHTEGVDNRINRKMLRYMWSEESEAIR